jgi:hypothetical protein
MNEHAQDRYMVEHDGSRYYSHDGVWFSDFMGDRYRVDSIERWDGAQFWSWCDRRKDWIA